MNKSRLTILLLFLVVAVALAVVSSYYKAGSKVVESIIETVIERTERIKPGYAEREKIEEALSFFEDGKRLHFKEQFEEARDHFETALDMLPEENMLLKAEFILWRGKASCNIGDYDSAMEDFNSYLEYSEIPFDGYMWIGHTYCEMGEADKCIEYLEKALDNIPEAPDSNNIAWIRNKLGRFKLEEGEYSEALEDLTRAIETSSVKKRPWYVRRAEIYLKLGRYEEAIADYEKLRELKLERWMPPLRIGNVYYVMNEYSKALDEYEKIGSWRYMRDASCRHSAMHYIEGDTFNAYATYLKYQKESPPEEPPVCPLHGWIKYKQESIQAAETFFDDYLETGEDKGEAYYFRAEVYSEAGDFERAAEDYGLAIVNGFNGAEILMRRGEALFHAGKFEEAERDFSGYLKDRPESAPVFSRRGVARFMMKDYEAAEADLTKSAGLNQWNPDTFFWLGRTKLKRVMLQAALKNLNRAVALAPWYGGYYAWRGAVYYELGNDNLARRDMATAMNLDVKEDCEELRGKSPFFRILKETGIGSDVSLRSGWKLNELLEGDDRSAYVEAVKDAVSVFSIIGDYNGAESRMSWLLEYDRDFDDPEFHFLLGMAFMGRGAYFVAPEYFNKAEEQGYPVQEIYMPRGINGFMARKYEEAAADFEEYIKLFPGSSEGYFWRGRCLEKMYHVDKTVEEIREEVKEEFREAITRDGFFSQAVYALVDSMFADDEDFEAWSMLEKMFSGYPVDRESGLFPANGTVQDVFDTIDEGAFSFLEDDEFMSFTSEKMHALAALKRGDSDSALMSLAELLFADIHEFNRIGMVDSVNLLAGAILIARGKYQAAERIFGDEIKMGSYDAEYYYFRGRLRLMRGEWEIAYKDFIRSEKQGIISEESAYMAACAAAMGGNSDKAAYRLGRAVDYGLGDWPGVKRDPCFVSLSGNSRFNEILKGLEQDYSDYEKYCSE